MKRQSVFISSIVLALATGAIAFATVADAAVVRHHFVHHTAGHHSGTHRHAARGSEQANRGRWVAGSRTGDDWAASQGWVNSYYDSHGVYGRNGDDYCGPIQWTLDTCNFYGP